MKERAGEEGFTLTHSAEDQRSGAAGDVCWGGGWKGGGGVVAEHKRLPVRLGRTSSRLIMHDTRGKEVCVTEGDTV